LVAELTQLTAQFPLRESLWARLLVALDRCGRQAEAVARYETIRVRIADELGVNPGRSRTATHSRRGCSFFPKEQPRQAAREVAHLVAEHFPGRYSAHDLLGAYTTELAHAHDSETVTPDRRAKDPG
jgi:DNA-binding SARP family transcriptional activator